MISSPLLCCMMHSIIPSFLAQILYSFSRKMYKMKKQKPIIIIITVIIIKISLCPNKSLKFSVPARKISVLFCSVHCSRNLSFLCRFTYLYLLLFLYSFIHSLFHSFSFLSNIYILITSNNYPNHQSKPQIPSHPQFTIRS